MPSVTIAMTFFALIQGHPLAGLPAKACSTSDLWCATPVAGTPTTTDDAGTATMRVPLGFRGYVDIAPVEADNLMPAIAALVPVPDKMDPASDGGPPSIPLLSKAELEFFAASVGKATKPEYGHLFFTAVDCKGNNAANATVRAASITADTFVYYTDGPGAPSITQTKTAESGYGGYLNLPAGSASLTMSLEGGRRIGTESVTIRGGAITYIRFGPTP